MARIRLEQILSPLRGDDNDLYMSGSFAVTGSSVFIQDVPGQYALASSGSLFIVDSSNSITGSLEGNPIDGGTF